MDSGNFVQLGALSGEWGFLCKASVSDTKYTLYIWVTLAEILSNCRVIKSLRLIVCKKAQFV
jgi:hypothetical protein